MADTVSGITGAAPVGDADAKSVKNDSTRPKPKPFTTAKWAEKGWDWGVPMLAVAFPIAGSILMGIGLRGKPPVEGQPAQPEITDLAGFLGSVSWFPTSWGVLLILVGISFNIANTRHTKAKLAVLEQKRNAHLTRFNDELASVISVFVELLRSEKDEESSKRFFSSAVRESRHLIGYPGTRVCVYQLELQEVDDSADAPAVDEEVWLLVRKAYGGRADPPRLNFTPDTDWGKTVIDIAKGTTAVPIPDPAEKDFHINRNSDAVWCSTLLVPLKYDHENKGILMIDTRDPVDFTNEDISVGWTIASIIALGMGSLVTGGQDTSGGVAELRQALEGLPADPPTPAKLDRVGAGE